METRVAKVDYRGRSYNSCDTSFGGMVCFNCWSGDTLSCRKCHGRHPGRENRPVKFGMECIYQDVYNRLCYCSCDCNAMAQIMEPMNPMQRAMQNCCCARKALDCRARGVREIHPPKGGVFSARLHGSADGPLPCAKNRISLLFCKVFTRSAKCVQVGINAIKYKTIGVVLSAVAVFCCCSTIEKFFYILHFADFTLCKVSFFGAFYGFAFLYSVQNANAKSLQQQFWEVSES